jgi:stage II sporulation protein M
MKKKFDLKKEYQQCFNYIKECRKFIYLIILIFVVFSLIGFFAPAPDSVSVQIRLFIEELLKQTQGMSQGELIKFIFLNNLQSSFFGMLFGAVLGIFPVIASLSNGYLLGFVAFESVKSEGIFVLWRIFPHGIFELPAVFISLGLGMKLGTFILEKKKIESFQKYFWNSLRVFFLIVIPLLIIAGIIEGSIIFLSG